MKKHDVCFFIIALLLSVLITLVILESAVLFLPKPKSIIESMVDRDLNTKRAKEKKEKEALIKEIERLKKIIEEGE